MKSGRLKTLSALRMAVAIASALLASAISDRTLARENRPNIILLVADDLSWVDTSVPEICLGHQSRYYETPQLERLADLGVSFTHAYTLQNCMPARVAILSGQYAPASNVYNNGSLYRPLPEYENETRIVPPMDQQENLSPDALSMGEMLGEAGYRVAIFGKTHGIEPASKLGTNHGFEINMAADKRFRFQYEEEDWEGIFRYDYLAIEALDGRWHFPSSSYQKYAAPYDKTYIREKLAPYATANDLSSLLRNPEKHPSPKHLTDAITDAVEDFISEMASREDPFFVFLPYHVPHSLFVARPDREQQFVRKESDDPRHSFATYAAMIAQMDESIGRILNRLEDPNADGNGEDGIADRTLVVFVSDNGGSDNTDNSPLRGRKGMFYEGGIRVPMIVRYPEGGQAGTIADHAVHVIDLYPTFADVAGASLPDPKRHQIDGVSFRSLLEGADRFERSDLFWHFPGYMDERQKPNSLILSRVGDEYYKLFYFYESATYAMYNITKELSETTDLLDGAIAPGSQSIATELSRKLRRWLVDSNAKMGTWRATGEPVEAPPVFQ